MDEQAQIREQIEQLQAQLANYKESTPTPSDNEDVPKNRVITFAPATPSPRKKRKEHVPKVIIARPVSKAAEMVYAKAGPSNVVAKMAGMSRVAATRLQESTAVQRSISFSDAPTIAPKVIRDENLVLIEDLEVGPVDHKPPFDDPLFLKLEPNSGIRLSSRIISHEDVQDHLRGRYYLSPSRLYSSIRLLPDKRGYDVPVPGDWVTLAVVAERGPIKFTRAAAPVVKEEDNAEFISSSSNNHNNKYKKKPKEEQPARGKKFVNIKLIDFGARSRHSNAKSVIRGDAFLTLLLFESDGFDMVVKNEGEKPTKFYKGGSRGAFEAMSKLKEGDVVALLNPKILKPFSKGVDTPHPVSNILAITPESADTISVIGRSLDLGMCSVTKRDGKVCGQWCDKRVSEVCEFHVEKAVKHARAGRPEFSMGTSGLSNNSAAKKKPAYDPVRKWGLKPEDASIGPTYVVSGHTINNRSANGMFVSENMGREGQAKATRKLSSKDSDRELKAMLERDKEGMRPLMEAREMARKLAEEKKHGGDKTKGKSKDSGKGKGKELEKKRKRRWSISDDDEEKRAVKHYPVNVLKHLGFDPSIKAGRRREDGDDEIRKKLDSLTEVQSNRKDIELGPRPGQKRHRTSVMVPLQPKVDSSSAARAREIPQLDDDGEDSDQFLEDGLRAIGGLPRKALAKKGKAVKEELNDLDKNGEMVDLDDI